jgi:hypothetical protein
MTIEETLRYQPEFIECEMLVKLGIYKTRKDIAHAKMRNDSPPLTRVSNKRWIIAKADLLKWLQERTTKEKK